MRIVSLMTVSVIIVFAFGCNRQNQEKSENPKWEMMKRSVSITTFEAQSQKDDVFTVKAVEVIANTGIKSVIVERERDGYLISALSARDIEIGSKIKLIRACRQLNSGKKLGSTIMIE